MSHYLLIQSQDPFVDVRTEHQYELIHNLASGENTVTVFLVQNGVMPANKNSISRYFDSLLERNIHILADAFSLKQRQIPVERLKSGILPADVDVVIKAMLAGHKVIWN